MGPLNAIGQTVVLNRIQQSVAATWTKEQHENKLLW